jgi:hypothetical protein
MYIAVGPDPRAPGTGPSRRAKREAETTGGGPIRYQGNSLGTVRQRG